MTFQLLALFILISSMKEVIGHGYFMIQGSYCTSRTIDLQSSIMWSPVISDNLGRTIVVRIHAECLAVVVNEYKKK